METCRHTKNFNSKLKISVENSGEIRSNAFRDEIIVQF